ncbi:hypothetical protein LTR97_009449 [Elasticomyces elasticus]|uniref:Uncharacterized protein n=1 Tax=Elasticomyces elasticus TaxID=574655 RepID=A0AAN7VWN4_9PEZI|nr:hypothetical protein LTR97_009449 [Elasticomyces elasticus]
MNIVIGFAPLLKPKDNCDDVPLTPSQRQLLGLPPMRRPATPQEQQQYVTPPRYSRSTTPQSNTSSLRAQTSGSPLNGRPLESSTSQLGRRSVSGSPGMGGASPLAYGGLRSNSSARRTSFQSSPLSTPEFDAAGSISTPTKSGKASVGLNSKWLYEKGRGSPRSSFGGLGGFGGGGIKHQRRLPPHTRAPRNSPEPRTATESTAPPRRSSNVISRTISSANDQGCSHCGKNHLTGRAVSPAPQTDDAATVDDVSEQDTAPNATRDETPAEDVALPSSPALQSETTAAEERQTTGQDTAPQVSGDEPPAEEDLYEDKYHNPKWWIVTDTPEDLAREQRELEEGAGWLKEAYRIAERKVVVKQPEETENQPEEVKEGIDHEDFGTTVPSGDELAATGGPSQSVSFAEASTLLRTPVSSWSTSLTAAQAELIREEASLREMGVKVQSQMEAKKQQLLHKEKQLKDLEQRMNGVQLQSGTPIPGSASDSAAGDASLPISSSVAEHASDTDVSPARSSADSTTGGGINSDTSDDEMLGQARQH